MSRRFRTARRPLRSSHCVEPLETRRLFAVTAGILDPTFEGKPVSVSQSPDGGVSMTAVQAVAVAPDGDIVVAGLGEGSVVVARYLPNGALDTAFGDDGFAVSDPVDLESSGVAGVVVAADATIVVAVNNEDVAQGELINFSATGNATTNVGGDFFAGDDYATNVNAIALVNGQVIAVGYGQSSAADGKANLATLAAASYNPDTLQPNSFSFNDTEQSFGGLTSVAPGLNGQILVGGQTGSLETPYVARLNSNGAVDTSFTLSGGSSPLGSAGAGVYAVAVQPSGKVDVISETAIEQLTTAGKLDTSFSGTGYRDSENYRELAVQSDGKIVVGGYAAVSNTTKPALVRLTASGSIDSTFGASAAGTEQLGSSSDAFTGMAVDGDGRIDFLTSLRDAGTGGIYRILPGEYAFAGSPTNISATATTTLQAENYDNGGEAVAYHDTDVTNDSEGEGSTYFSPYRPGSGVDIEKDTDGSNSQHLAFVRSGEYVQYTITVPTAGTYNVNARVGDGFGGSNFHFSIDGSAKSEVTVPDTGGYLTFKTISAGALSLSAGMHVLRVTFDSVDTNGTYVCNFNWFSFAAAATTGSISGTVFNDTNGNGTKDSGDAGISGVTVYNDTNNNSKLDSGEATAATNSGGLYTFTGLAAGSYKIRQVLPDGSKQTSPANGYGYTITLASNQSITGDNFGQQKTAVTGSITGTVFNDVNGSGTKDAGDTGISGITVYNDANNNSKLDSGEATAVTNSGGTYTFTGLAAGSYKIRQVLPSGSEQTTPANGYGYTITLAAGQNIAGDNFGQRKSAGTGTVSGTVFNDLNQSYIQDSGESGISGVKVYLDANNNGTFDSGDVSTTTRSTGTYTFSNVPVATAHVRIVTPSGYRIVAGSPDHYDVSVTAGANDAGKIFALTTHPALTGRVFLDTNGNGKLDTGEAGLAGWTVYIDLNNNGKFDSNENSKITDSNGDFAFYGLNPGTYVVRVVAPSGYTQTFPSGGLGSHVTLSAGVTTSAGLFGEKHV